MRHEPGLPFLLRTQTMAAVKPSIDVVKNIAAALDTTVGYLLGESKKQDVLKDTAMLKRLNDIASFPDEDKKHILYTLDALIKSVKLKAI